jgi:hypothetical protein
MRERFAGPQSHVCLMSLNDTQAQSIKRFESQAHGGGVLLRSKLIFRSPSTVEQLGPVVMVCQYTYISSSVNLFVIRTILIWFIAWQGFNINEIFHACWQTVLRNEYLG